MPVPKSQILSILDSLASGPTRNSLPILAFEIGLLLEEVLWNYMLMGFCDSREYESIANDIDQQIYRRLTTGFHNTHELKSLILQANSDFQVSESIFDDLDYCEEYHAILEELRQFEPSQCCDVVKEVDDKISSYTESLCRFFTGLFRGLNAAIIPVLTRENVLNEYCLGLILSSGMWNGARQFCFPGDDDYGQYFHFCRQSLLPYARSIFEQEKGIQRSWNTKPMPPEPYTMDLDIGWLEAVNERLANADFKEVISTLAELEEVPADRQELIDSLIVKVHESIFRRVEKDMQSEESRDKLKLIVYPEKNIIILNNKEYDFSKDDVAASQYTAIVLAHLILKKGESVSLMNIDKRAKADRIKGYLRKKGLSEIADLITTRSVKNHDKDKPGTFIMGFDNPHQMSVVGKIPTGKCSGR